MLLRGGYIVNSDRKFLGDILIENNTIKQIGLNIVSASEVKIIDVTDKLIIPGGIDPSTNFNLTSNGKEILQQESKAAVAGGTTTIMTKVKELNGVSLVDTVKKLQSDLKSKLYCNYGFYPEINAQSEESAKVLENLVQNFGINSFQMKIGNEITSNIIAILTKCRELNCLVRLNIEDKQYENLVGEELLAKGISGPEGFLQSKCLDDEIERIYKILKLNYAFPCGLIMPSIMNEDVAKIISQVKKQGRPIFCETITAALALSSKIYQSEHWEEAASVVMDPPLRNDQNEAIMRSIHCGDIDMVSSQHTTISNGERSVGKRDFRDIPQGVIGAEERLTLLWDRGVRTGIISESEFVAATSTNAAKLFNMYPERGHIAVGSVADIVVWNPDRIKTINAQHLNNDMHIFDGLSCQGAPDQVIVNGSIKFNVASFVGTATGEKIGLKNNCKMLTDKLNRYETLREFGKLSIQRELGDIVAHASIKNIKQPSKPEATNGVQETKNEALKKQRPPTSGGGRNMQDSSFTLSGNQIDDEKPIRSTIRTNHPPGGKSSLIF